jgi:hypothetical protein
MHEPLLERIRQLERSVRRWRLACLALVIIVISLLAIGGTFGLVLLSAIPDRREVMVLRAEAEAQRARAEEAMQAERAARQAAERAMQAERAARQRAEQRDGP